MGIPSFVTAIISGIVYLAQTAWGLVKGKQDDTARKDGITQQQLADTQATSAAQEKIDATPYPAGPSDLDDSLQPNSKSPF